MTKTAELENILNSAKVGDHFIVAWYSGARSKWIGNCFQHLGDGVWAYQYDTVDGVRMHSTAKSSTMASAYHTEAWCVM